MDWKSLLAYVAGSVDEQLLLRNEYLVEENRILRDQIKGRLYLSDADRQIWPRSATNWASRRWKKSPKSPSRTRPRVDKELEDWVVGMAKERLYIAMGFLYLSVVSVQQRPQEEETYLLRTQTNRALYWTGFFFVSGFAFNLVSRLEPGKASMGWWLFSGRLEVLFVFAAFAVVSRWWYWSRIGHLLNDSDSPLR